MLSLDDSAHLITRKIEEALAQQTGCLIGRNGSTELQTLFYFDAYKACNIQMAKALERYSGVFPATEQTLKGWVMEYKNSLKAVGDDPIVAGWFVSLSNYEMNLLKMSCPSAHHMPLRALEPYYVSPEKRWTRTLAGKRVAVVSTFAKSIEAQIPKAEAIWGADFETLLPSSTTWFPIQTGFPPQIAGGMVEWPHGCNTWKLAVDSMETQIVASKVHICLIGCGALGMILGARLKARGIVCIVMGGAIQVLFGIKGQRWEKHSIIERFWNDAWVWPRIDEVPSGAMTIEQGCYWSPR